MVALVALIAGSVINPVGEMVVNQWLKAQRINIVASPYIELKQEGLETYARDRGISSFNLDLDDTASYDYAVLEFVVETRRAALPGPFKLNIYSGSEFSKIVDLKWRILSPTDRETEIVSTFPEWKWVFPVLGVPESLSWDAGNNQEDLAGFNIYRSLWKDRGFGRVNASIVKSLSWTALAVPRADLSPACFRVTAVSVSGDESELGGLIEIPNRVGACINGYVAKDGSSAAKLGVTFTDGKSSIADFARGRTELVFPAGLEARAKIKIHMLVKPIPGVSLSPSITVSGSTDIVTTTKGLVSTSPVRVASERLFDPKANLTPSVVHALLSEGKVYLHWGIDEGNTSEGVVVLRSENLQMGDTGRSGSEIFRGVPKRTGLTKTTSFANRLTSIKPSAYNISSSDRISLAPPPNKGESSPLVSLAAPSAVTASVISTFEGFHVVDNPPDAEAQYTYTIYQYDKAHNFGNPVMVTISMTDVFPGSIRERLSDDIP